MQSKSEKMMNVLVNIAIIIFCIICIVPFVMLISISLSDESSIQEGYSLFIKDFSLDAYKFVFQNPTQILNAYKITAIITFLGTVLGVVFMAMAAYCLSMKDCRFRNQFSFYLFFTMLFSGGMVPSYILITRTLGLGNTIWALILPSLISPWYIFLLRTFFAGIPYSLYEATKIDGAGQLTIFFRVYIPLSKPALATVALMVMLTKWNEWYSVLLYITDEKLMTLQYLLQRIMKNLELVETYAKQGGSNISLENVKIPSETVRMAMAVVVAGPMLLVFPFFQKYFTRGMTIGAVKG